MSFLVASRVKKSVPAVLEISDSDRDDVQPSAAASEPDSEVVRLAETCQSAMQRMHMIDNMTITCARCTRCFLSIRTRLSVLQPYFGHEAVGGYLDQPEPTRLL